MQPTLPFGGPPPLRDNNLPLAFDMPIGVKTDGIVSSVVSGADVDGDPLEYEFLILPSQGTVDWDGRGSISGTFTYHANASASRTDYFTFRACDIVGCSAVAG